MVERSPTKLKVRGSNPGRGGQKLKEFGFVCTGPFGEYASTD